MAEFIETSGPTVAEALRAAAQKLGCSQNEIEYTIVEKPSRGFFGLFGGHGARIKAVRRQDVVAAEKKAADSAAAVPAAADKAAAPAAEAAPSEPAVSAVAGSAKSADEHQPESTVESAGRFAVRREQPADEAGEEREPLDPAEAARAVDRGVAFLHDVFAAMHIEVSIERSDTPDGAELALIGDNLGILIGKHGQTLDALQYLANLAANRGLEGGRAHIIIDIEGYRARREETLMRLAGHLADKACRIGQEIHLEPMNRHERKIIHMALQKSHRVSTYSAGEEPRRYVVIVPRKRPRRRYQSHSHDNE